MNIEHSNALGIISIIIIMPFNFMFVVGLNQFPVDKFNLYEYWTIDIKKTKIIINSLFTVIKCMFTNGDKD